MLANIEYLLIGYDGLTTLPIHKGCRQYVNLVLFCFINERD